MILNLNFIQLRNLSSPETFTSVQQGHISLKTKFFQLDAIIRRHLTSTERIVFVFPCSDSLYILIACIMLKDSSSFET